MVAGRRKKYGKMIPRYNHGTRAKQTDLACLCWKTGSKIFFIGSSTFCQFYASKYIRALDLWSCCRASMIVLESIDLAPLVHRMINRVRSWTQQDGHRTSYWSFRGRLDVNIQQHVGKLQTGRQLSLLFDVEGKLPATNKINNRQQYCRAKLINCIIVV